MNVGDNECEGNEALKQLPAHLGSAKAVESPDKAANDGNGREPDRNAYVQRDGTRSCGKNPENKYGPRDRQDHEKLR